ncbi:WhiB family transcriptional regulator [Streptomyces monticola]|uniref:Transcriptional regulator WhiB n=1 Tax=Streptomyces monticola TaxID=2666263 RepID=A0ABW2JEN5_9ACTN
MDWLQDAACAEVDPELFFPVGDGGPSVEQTRRAKELCRRCPVAERCLDWALETGQSEGVWGGAASEERREMRSRLRIRSAR